MPDPAAIPAPDTDPASGAPALKEWGAAIAALLAGRQTVLLRKGGIGEKRFTLGRHQPGGDRFLLYPTVAHSHAEATRPEHHDLLPVGDRDVRRDPDGAPTSVTVRAVAEAFAAVPVERPQDIAALEPFHIWTTASVHANRIDFRPRHRLAAIVLRVRPLVDPLDLPVLAAYGGCRSWIELSGPTGDPDVDVGPPVVADDELGRIADLVRRAVG